MVSTSTCMLSTSAVWWSTMEVCVSVQTQSPQRSSRWSLSPWTRSVVPPRAASCACRELAKSYTLFTPPRQTSQYCLVLSVSVVWTILQTRQDSFVLSQPDFPFATEIYWGLLKTRKLETGSRQDRTHWNWVKTRQNCLALCAFVFTLRTWTRQDSFILFMLAVWTSCHRCSICVLSFHYLREANCRRMKLYWWKHLDDCIWKRVEGKIMGKANCGTKLLPNVIA